MERGNKSYQQAFKLQNCCVIIPTYNNAATLSAILDDILEYTDQIIVVDDGSTDSSPEILSAYPTLDVIRFPKNKGKGMALRKAFRILI